ncbi:hypothetical protein QK292_17275 [Arthrobacter sp. AL08]|uniref:hypothetical protein n=1 Tax=unclassified Arthrobacter TaxID=235627 RepID=UPI00249C3E93|nr:MULTISPECIES: hypothetical protein [unclassified Arthrobacter]MDI3243300.1 hypothetical protein [Arthrobacter sp. AL05]MDI3279309.1 hypothetical protein [Arthrobacter sp. AL08]
MSTPRRALILIDVQVQSRYGLGVNGTEAAEASFSPALTRVQQSRSVVESERNQAVAARTDAIVARADVTGASRNDREAGGEPAWESGGTTPAAGRKSGRQGDREAVSSRFLADKHDGAHSSAAVAQKPPSANASKMTNRRGKGRMIEPGGPER